MGSICVSGTRLQHAAAVAARILYPLAPLEGHGKEEKAETVVVDLHWRQNDGVWDEEEERNGYKDIAVEFNRAVPCGRWSFAGSR